MTLESEEAKYYLGDINTVLANKKRKAREHPSFQKAAVMACGQVGDHCTVFLIEFYMLHRNQKRGGGGGKQIPRSR